MTNYDDMHQHMDTPRYSECYGHLAHNRCIFIGEDIHKDLSSDITAMLLFFDETNENEDISIYINTHGGDAAACVSILSVMKMVKAPIKTINIGNAYSAGAFILSAGTKGKRFALRHSSAMIHGIQANIPKADNKKSEVYINFLKDHNRSMLEVLAKNTGKSYQEIAKDCDNDLYMTAEDSVKYGLVDHIL